MQLEELKAKLIALSQQYKETITAKVTEIKAINLAKQQALTQQTTTTQPITTQTQPQITKAAPVKTSTEPPKNDTSLTEENKGEEKEEEKSPQDKLMLGTQDVMGALISTVYKVDKVTDDNEENDEHELNTSVRIDTQGNVEVEHEKELAEDLTLTLKYDSAKKAISQELEKEFKIAKLGADISLPFGVLNIGIGFEVELAGTLKQSGELVFDSKHPEGSLTIGGGLKGKASVSVFVDALLLVEARLSAFLTAEANASGTIALKNNVPSLDLAANIIIGGGFDLKLGAKAWVQDILDYLGAPKCYTVIPIKSGELFNMSYKTSKKGKPIANEKIMKAVAPFVLTLQDIQAKIDAFKKVCAFVTDTVASVNEFVNEFLISLGETYISWTNPALSQILQTQKNLYTLVIQKALVVTQRDKTLLNKLLLIKDDKFRKAVLMEYIKQNPVVKEANQAIEKLDFTKLSIAYNEIAATVTYFEVTVDKPSYILGEAINITATAKCDKAFAGAIVTAAIYNNKVKYTAIPRIVTINAGTTIINYQFTLPKTGYPETGWTIRVALDAEMNNNDRVDDVKLVVTKPKV